MRRMIMKDRMLALLEDVRDRLETIQSFEEIVKKIRSKNPIPTHSSTPPDVTRRLIEKRCAELRYYIPEFQAQLLRILSDLETIVHSLPLDHELRIKSISSLRAAKHIINLEEEKEGSMSAETVIDGLICVGNEFKKLENDLRDYIDEE